MRYKQLVIRKLTELRNQIAVQDSQISMLRPPIELKDQLEKMISKIQEIEVLLNTEHEE
jgi:hypothetical protein